MTTQPQNTIVSRHFILPTNDGLKTSSIAVAMAFGKNHKDVLRRINSLDAPPDFTQRNFTLSHKINKLANGKKDPHIEMTKDGFMLLVMGFTGKKAMAIKIAYINAFNMMAEELARQQKQVDQAKQKQLQEIGSRAAKEHELFRAAPAYRIEARDYVCEVLEDCRAFAVEHGISMADWELVDRDKAASGILADMLHGIRAELTFNSMTLEPQFKILPPGAMYIMPTDPDCMMAIADRVVSKEVLAAMLQAGIARLAAGVKA
jgi:Rha family phage regulatory protein